MTSQVANNVNVDSAAARDMRQFNNTSQFDVDIDPNEGRTVGKSAAEAGVLANSREAEILQYLGVDLQTLESDQLKKTAKDVDDAIAAMLMLNMDLMAMLLALMDLCTKVINRTRRDNMAFEAQVTTAQCEKIIDMFEKKLEAIQVTCDATKKGALASMATCGVGMAFSIGGAVAGAAAVQGFGHGLSSMSQAVGTYVSAEDNMKAQQQHAVADMGLRMLTVCDQVARNIQDRLRALLDEMKKIIEAQTASVQKIAQSGVAMR